MPKFQYTPSTVEVRVSPFIIGDTKVNQLVWNDVLETRQTHDGLMFVEMRGWRIPYALVEASATPAGDGWGEEITSGPFVRQPFTLFANNNTLVEVTADPNDPHFGRLLAIKDRSIQGTGLTPQQEWDGIINSFPGNYLPQGDFMCYVRDNVPQKMGDMQRYHIHMADLGGAFSK